MRSTTLAATLIRNVSFAVAAGVTAPSLAAAASQPFDHAPIVLSMVVPSPRAGEASEVHAGLGREALAYRFRVRTADGAVVPGAWTATVYAASADGGYVRYNSVARLSSLRQEIALPRPYGYAFGDADSLVVVVETLTEAAPPDLQVTVEFEPAQTAASRWGVLPQLANAVRSTTADDKATERAWEWTPTVGGKVQMVTGANLAAADEVVLSDVETGRVLRRIGRAGRAQSGDVVCDVGFIRIQATVEAGRRYRLTAVYRTQAGRDADSVVHALVLPNRADTN